MDWEESSSEVRDIPPVRARVVTVRPRRPPPAPPGISNSGIESRTREKTEKEKLFENRGHFEPENQKKFINQLEN